MVVWPCPTPNSAKIGKELIFLGFEPMTSLKFVLSLAENEDLQVDQFYKFLFFVESVPNSFVLL